jgi:hypothetical protein
MFDCGSGRRSVTVGGVHGCLPRKGATTVTRAQRKLAGACASLAVLVLVLVPAGAQAAVTARTSVRFPPSVQVGQTGLPASITLENLNTGVEEYDLNVVCNADDDGAPCSTPEPGIVVVPACKQVVAGQCAPAGADPGVFRVSPTATGRAGSACEGMTFTTAIVDPTFGTVGFTPDGGDYVVLERDVPCHIDFTVDVLKSPTGDQKPATSAVDTVSLTSHRQVDVDDPAEQSSLATGVSSGTAVSRVRPHIEAGRSESVPLGAPISTTATVWERVDPEAGATIDFRLYGPLDRNCTGLPVFTALGVPYPVTGGQVTSPPFTPTHVGEYHWVATYSGDKINQSVSTFCGVPTVSVNPAPPPPRPMPRCNGKTATIVAKFGKRSIKGTPGPDVIVGNPLGERIDAGGGDDTICGGMGDDIVHGGAGNDTILAGSDQDRLFGDAGDDVLLGESGNDDLRGGSGNDRAGGGDGADRIDGGSGNDLLDDQALGGKGRDLLLGGAGADRVRTAGGGADRVDCGAGRDSVVLDARDRRTRCERVSRRGSR